MNERRQKRILRAAALLGLFSIGMITWGLWRPGFFSVVISLTVGQAVGTLSLGLYGFVVIRTMPPHEKRAKTADGEEAAEATEAAGAAPPPESDDEPKEVE